MRLRQEQVVFWLALALVGGLFATSNSSSGRRMRAASNADAELPEYRVPDVARAVTPPEAGVPAGRELFAPPRDTRTLDPLEFEVPPRSPLAILVPPPVPGTEVPRYADFLLGRPVALDASALFGAEGELDAGEGLFSGDLAEDSESEDPPDTESVEDRAARLESFKATYDWVRLNEYSYLFGRIENAERYGLNDVDREAEPIEFLQLEPEDGTETFPGQRAIAYERERVTSFGFADTVANRIELRWHELPAELSPSSFQRSLELGRYCLDQRLNAPRALEVAEDVFTRAAASDPGVYEPRLGLARCYEAAFDFERALGVYTELVADFPNEAAPRVGLAGLDERFLLFDSAEHQLRAAVRLEPGDYAPQLALGRFLARRGRTAEAIEPLRRADRFAPNEPGQFAVRVAIRTSLGRARRAPV